MKPLIVVGTRPEIIKMSPIIRELGDRNIAFSILHTGQHYSYNMDKVFFEQLQLPKPDYNLKIGSGTHGEETGKMLIGIEKVLFREKPDIVLLEGDTNSVLAGSLAASKLMIKVGHVEAGLRSYDRTMPEEVNRVIADHLSDYLFAPTQVSRRNLLKEGIEDKKIHVVGNTIVDAVLQNLELARNVSLPRMSDDRFFLATLHRQENVDDPSRLKDIMEGLDLLSEKLERKIICPMHPRTKKRLKQYNIDVQKTNIKIIDPVDYLSFLRLESKAELVLTDSGGVQEEACILKVPCVTLRYNTERPETVEVKANVLAGPNPEKILRKAEEMLGRKRNWVNPFGDGHSAKRIIDILIK